MLNVLAEVAAGFIGAAILGLSGWGATLIRGALQNRRFPIAGRYALAIEDPAGGTRVSTKAEAVLRQRGQRVGSTWAVETQRRLTSS